MKIFCNGKKISAVVEILTSRRITPKFVVGHPNPEWCTDNIPLETMDNVLVETTEDEILGIFEILMPPKKKTVRWTLCSEKLPNESENVLAIVCNRGNLDMEILRRDNGRWEDVDGDNVDHANVLAWYLLPEPRKEESEEI